MEKVNLIKTKLQQTKCSTSTNQMLDSVQVVSTLGIDSIGMIGSRFHMPFITEHMCALNILYYEVR